MKKKCDKCFKFKYEEDFVKHSRGMLRNTCIACWRLRDQMYYKKHTRRINNRASKNRLNRMSKIVAYLKEHPCVDCGETDIIVLEFDHVKGKKFENISTMALQKFSWNKILKEISKCEVRCANCHKRQTATRQNSIKLQIINNI